jgi:putative glutamine amidotransferase
VVVDGAKAGEMPLIGVTRCRKLDDYQQAVLHVGGEVRIVESSMQVADALDGVDGLLLTGGEDVDPTRYGEVVHPTVTDVDPQRDAFEIGLVLEARARQLPILAICRGLQLLNVACGGTLVQDVPSQMPGGTEHLLAVPAHHSVDLAHEIWIDKGTLLAALLSDRLNGADTCDVNSRHHQAVKAPAPGFRVSATAPDGVIEAIEDPSIRFCLGVQWHPENFWRTGEFRSLFEGFLEASESRKTERAPELP